MAKDKVEAFISERGYKLEGRLQPGLFGRRRAVRHLASGAPCILEFMRTKQPYAAAVAQNARFADLAGFPTLAPICEAGDPDDAYPFAITGMHPRALRAVSLDIPLPEAEVWRFLSDASLAVLFLHNIEYVHALLCPSSVFAHGDGFFVAELWCLHNTSGKPFYPPLAEHFPAHMPAFAKPFCAPELLEGNPPSRESDIYALGSTTYYLATGRNVPPGRLDIPTLWQSAPELSRSLKGVISLTLQSPAHKRPSAEDVAGMAEEYLQTPTETTSA